MFSCKSRYACGKSHYSDSDEDSSYGFKVAGNRTRAVLLSTGNNNGRRSPNDDAEYHIYGNVTFGYKPILKTRLSSAASSMRRRTLVKRTVSFSGVESSAAAADVVYRRPSVRPPPPCYAVAVRRASSFSVTRRNAAEIVARRQRMPLPDENDRFAVPAPPQPSAASAVGSNRCSTAGLVAVDVHRESNFANPPRPSPSSQSTTTDAAALLPGLDKSPPKPAATVDNNVALKTPNATDIAGQRMDSYRFSMANLEDTQDVDLDAVLGELCALESQYQSTNSLLDSEKNDSNSANRMSSNQSAAGGTVVRTDSPDNDSAFSDCVSLLSSSESSASSSGTTNHTDNKESSKAEKIRLALQKMKEASVKKLFIKVFNDDGGAKSLLVDEGMRCSYVMRLLADKHHINLGPRWGLVEHLPDLHMERVYEEHELLVDNLMLWTRDSKNRLLFVERPERTLIFECPSLFNSNRQQSTNHHTSNFAQEYFCNGGLPSVEGPLYIKTDSRKGWKKYYSVLRASGLYYYKDKVSRSPKDLVCLSTFDVNQVYYGVGWKKKYKSPTEYCFAIKHPCLQQPKSTKYIKYVCAEDERTLQKWMSAIRIVKYGQQLLENYESALVGGGQQMSLLHRDDRRCTGTGPAADMMMMEEDIESGLSDSGSSSGCDVAFESDYPPCGTIKRKPPKLPLTATTRQLTCSVETTSAAAVAAAAAAAATTNNSPSSASSTVSSQQKPVKTVKFADHYHHHHHHHRHHHHGHNQHYRTPSLESLPPPPPELLVDNNDADDEPNDQDIMSVVPPPPPKLLSPPSTAFLADLHRVVCKKWQVAQKCKLDTMATPHEVLGFRDPAHPHYGESAGTYSREANVSNWVAEHYGPNNLYENIYPTNNNNNNKPAVATCSSPPPPPPPNRLSIVANTAVACAMLKKRPPPPPPPRSEKTQLTTVVL